MEHNYSYLFNWVYLISYIFLVLMLIFFVQLWWIPKRIENYFMNQGIKGPKYQLLLGNIKEIASLNLKASTQSMPLSHDILPRVLSFYHHWKTIYGPTFLVWFGRTGRLIISDPTLIKEILVLKSEYFEKNEPPLQVKRTDGNGLLNLKGEKWSHHRTIIQPIFHKENLKLMIPMIAKIMEETLNKLSEEILSNNGKVEIEVFDWFQNLVENVITRATFGTSYEAGQAIYKLQAKQIVNTMEAYHKLSIPGYRFLPTKKNITFWRLEKEFRKSLLNLINDKRTNTIVSDEFPNHLLELMIKAVDHDESNQLLALTENDVVEEVKTFFFAGKQTTSNLITWTAVLLAMHPTWQEQAREEILTVCGARDTPTKDDLAKLKMV